MAPQAPSLHSRLQSPAGTFAHVLLQPPSAAAVAQRLGRLTLLPADLLVVGFEHVLLFVVGVALD